MVSFAELQPDIGHPDDGSSMSRTLTFLADSIQISFSKTLGDVNEMSYR